MNSPLVADVDFTLYVGDAIDVLSDLPTGVVDACVTSPPYLDARPEYPSPTLSQFAAIFRELRRVVSGVALVNVGRIFRDRREVRWWVDLVAVAEDAGWAHLDTRIWVKPNANPIRGEVFADRHEYILVLGEPGVSLNVDAIRTPYTASSLARLQRGWTNHVGVKDGRSRTRGRKTSEPHPLGARPGSYVVVETGGEKGNLHPAPMPLDLACELVALASWPGDTVIDPFGGGGTTARAARKLGRNSVLIELDPDFAALAADAMKQQTLFSGIS